MPMLDAFHRDRWWTGVADMVERVARELRLFELAFAHRRPRDRWRRLRWVLDQARAFEEGDGGTLRDFVAWADRQADEDARVKESPLPEADDDAVRILTVHGAGGNDPTTTRAGTPCTRRKRQGEIRTGCAVSHTRRTRAPPRLRR